MVKKIVIGVLLLLVLVVGIGVFNRVKNKENTKKETVTTENTVSPSGLSQDVAETPKPVNEYQQSLGLDTDKGDGRVEVTETPFSSEEPILEITAKYEPEVIIFDKTSVRDILDDGSSTKKYFDSVSLNDFDKGFGSDLTDEDFKGNDLYLIGVQQNPDDYLVGDLQSTGWLINNISDLKKNDAIKFTNLHVIGSLSDNHVALLCTYDFYSVFGMKDTLVVFEDMSGTLDTKDFSDGSIFSALVFRHNVKVKAVNGQNVIIVKYDTFKE